MGVREDVGQSVCSNSTGIKYQRSREKESKVGHTQDDEDDHQPDLRHSDRVDVAVADSGDCGK